MATAFNILLNVLLISALAVFLYAIGSVVIATGDPLERALRSAALFCGALAVVGAHASGASYAQFIVESLSQTPTLGVSLVAVSVPSAAGVVIAWYFVRVMRRSTDLMLRLLGFIGMLATAQFAAVYVLALEQNGVEIGAAALPNMSFAFSMLLYVVLKIDPGQVGPPDRSRRARSSRLLRRLADRLGGSERPRGAVAEHGTRLH